MRRLLAALILLSSSLSAFALPYSGVYFFGDSLTDVGNVQNVYAGLPHAPGAPTTVPGAPYDAQGRASNGAIYADVLAGGLGFSATPSTTGGNDYAYSGARTRYQTMGPDYQGILSQIGSYRALPGGADAGALYVVWGGSNNLQDIIVGKTVDALGQPVPDLFSTVADIIQGISALYAEGARSFLVPNAPDLGLTPRVSGYGSAAVAGAHQLSLAYDGLLAVSLAKLQAATPDIRIIGFDVYSLLNRLVANPADYGISNTTDRCYTGDDLSFTGGGSVCANPDSYLFWDGIHPTSAVHAILGEAMLAAVPEPETLYLMAIALLALASVARRRAGASGRL
ncbi:SGNH/GDSL hydrolase family protein [Rhodocyclus tenuis]|uniref:Phospholipase/lecithinase/hemolysin n=1 Tax=Rhodocyclus tenuis TaxID=1066 RepID=A0A840G6S9_RHOTE|nr:SGNH/GDSL hydrolase family protein [Rhodocyclus tenuis]MBB4247575.1 phospholipase/lecithinase/hemolysin [Rhodocyclus tenuis]